MNLGGKKIYVITGSVLYGNSILTEIITAIKNGKRAKELCKAHNKAQKNSIMPETWKCNEVLLFKEIEDFISYEARKEKEKEEKAQRADAGIYPNASTAVSTAPFVVVSNMKEADKL